MQTLSDIAFTAGKLLLENKLMLVTAESCTGGWLAKQLTDVAGSSGWFERGFITYSNAAKIDMLDVNPETIEICGAVSREVVMQMAQGALTHSRAHIAVSISGIAGPGGGTLDKPVGTVWIGWASQLFESQAECNLFDGDREAVRRQSVAHALQGIINRLDGEGIGSY